MKPEFPTDFTIQHAYIGLGMSVTVLRLGDNGKRVYLENRCGLRDELGVLPECAIATPGFDGKPFAVLKKAGRLEDPFCLNRYRAPVTIQQWGTDTTMWLLDDKKGNSMNAQ